MEPTLGLLAEKSLTFLLLAIAIAYFYREKIARDKVEEGRQERESERHKEIEERFEKLRGERESERMQLLAAQNQLVEVIRENTSVIKGLKKYIENANQDNPERQGT